MTTFRQILTSGAICLSAGLLLTSCFDDSYDLSKDIDMTVGLGGNGLGVRLGNTERITLDNLLEVDKSVKLDAANLYYLVEQGSARVNFDLQSMTSEVNNALIHTSMRVLSYESARQQFEQTYGTSLPEGTPISVPSGFKASGPVVGSSQMNFSVDHLDEAIKHISSIQIKPIKVALYVRNSSSAGVRFGARSVENVRFTLPKMIHVASATVGTMQDNVLTIGHADITADGKITEVTIDQINPGKDGTPDVNHSIAFSSENLTVSMQGTLNLDAQQAFTMKADDYADVVFDLVVDGHTDGAKSQIVVQETTGQFDPTISPHVDPIEVSASLPDFLQDAEVALPATNPTVRFEADMTDIPVDLDFSGKLTAEKQGTADRSVVLPSTGSASLDKNQHNVVYFHQGQSPYDPDHTSASTDKTYQVSGISKLISPLPDRIQVNLADRHITVPQDKEYTVRLGRSYEAQTDYSVYVPFEFSGGLKIVYNDSTNSMNKDLKDYAAEGIRISADVENAIPLELIGNVEAVDVDGNLLPNVHFDEIHIGAGTGDVDRPVTSAVNIEATLSDPYELKKVDRLFFHVHAASAADDGSHTLVSTQYLRLTNVRLRLLGRIIADFN